MVIAICPPFSLIGKGIKVDSSFSQQQSSDVQHLVTEPGRITLLLPVVLVLACMSACSTTSANLFKLGDSFRNFRIRYPWVDNGDVRHCGFSCFSPFSTLKWTPIPAFARKGSTGQCVALILWHTSLSRDSPA